MCYSAQIQSAYMKYLRETGAEMDVDQFVEIFGHRVVDSSIRIPRAVERWFDGFRGDARACNRESRSKDCCTDECVHGATLRVSCCGLS